MNKKTIKVMALILIIGISVPVITAATSNQELVPTLFSVKEPDISTKYTTSKISIADEYVEKVHEAKTIPDEDFNIQGRWGIYSTRNEGEFKGSEEENIICGKAWYNNQKVYFYIKMNKYLRTFDGVVLYNDDFHTIDGNYLKKDGKFIALWTCEGVDGWITGEIL